MKVITPEISWHGRDPIYSVDFQYHNEDIQRMATCGTDRHIRLWSCKLDENDKLETDILCTLTRHTRTVNCVRFSPDGKILASGGDDSVILLWRLNDAPTPVNSIFAEDEEDNKENWTVFKSLRSHLEDIYDISWSSDSKNLVSGSVDNSAILWDIKKGCRLAIFPEHKSFVQGVAFDPLGQFVGTMSSDRSCRIYNIAAKNCIHNISKLSLPNQQTEEKTEGEVVKPKSFRMFHDDTMKSFFRRLTYSPDGQLLIVPAGCIEINDQVLNTTYIFTRASPSKPVLHLPGPSKATLAVRCCPLLYELKKIPRKNESDDQNNNGNEEWEKYETLFCLPYRMIFAVATEDSVLLYDTQQPRPFAYVTNIHYHTLSDLAWSKDGRILVIASSDGYCTMITFGENELGTLYKDQPLHAKPKEESDKGTSTDDLPKSIKSVPKDKTEQEPTEMEIDSSTNETQSSKQMSSTDELPKPVKTEQDPGKMEVDSSTKETQGSKNTSTKPGGPRRVALTTLTTVPKNESSTKQDEVKTSVATSKAQTEDCKSPSTSKTARRVQVTTLKTVASPQGKSLTPQKTKPKTTSSPNNAQTKKNPRRITVTTLATNKNTESDNAKDVRQESEKIDNSAAQMNEDTSESTLHLVLETSNDASAMDTSEKPPRENKNEGSEAKNSDTKNVNTDTNKKKPKRIQPITLTTVKK